MVCGGSVFSMAGFVIRLTKLAEHLTVFIKFIYIYQLLEFQDGR
jgi:hypothetical protein